MMFYDINRALVHPEHYPEASLAAHHSFISRLGLLERKDFICRMDSVELAESKRVFGIGRNA